MRSVIAAAISAFAAGCGSADEPRYDASPTVVHGYYRWTDLMDHQSTISIGIEGETICVAGGVDIPDRRDGGHPTFVVLEGYLSQRGSFGYLGDCARMFRVSRVVEVRDATPAEINSLSAYYGAQRALDCAGGAAAAQPAGYCP